ncbi:MAG TPA: hypothetical protein VKS19_01420 [Verrucomicrobiae bacterium]|nr:hypothetical protein [Verrucomicrobiae bacterium]
MASGLSGRQFETVVLDQFAAIGIQIILNHPNPRHGGGNSCSTVNKIPVMRQQFSNFHDLDTGRFGFPELAFMQNRKRGGLFALHFGDSVPQKLP